MYCYYTQFSSALASGAADPALRRAASCLLSEPDTAGADARELHQALEGGGWPVSLGRGRCLRATAAFDRRRPSAPAGALLARRSPAAAEPVRRPARPPVQRALAGNEQGHHRHLRLARHQGLLPGHGPVRAVAVRRIASWTWCTGSTRHGSWRSPASLRIRRASTRCSSPRSSAPRTASPSSTSSASWTRGQSRTWSCSSTTMIPRWATRHGSRPVSLHSATT